MSQRARHRARGLALGMATLALAGIASVCLWANGVRLPDHALRRDSVESLRLVDRRGQLLREVLARPDGRARWTPLAAISFHVISATIAIEDQRFWRHRGVDWLAVVRALATNYDRGRIVSGASTLTMQLVRLLAPAKRGILNKVGQALLAMRLEGRLDKLEILEHYLNRAPYGRGTFGVEAAAQRYFRSSAQQLSLAQAALLAALPKAPSGYDPYRGGRQKLLRRQRQVLLAMHRQGLIDHDQLRRAAIEKVQFEESARPFFAPHFTASLERKRASGRLRTTIDLRLQQVVESAVANTVNRLASHGVSQAAVLVVDNHSGDILAHVGSADFLHASAGKVDGALALRQPGSAIKPFVYQLALERGQTLASIADDLRTEFPTEYGSYSPRNYDGHYHGPLPLRVTLASSLNVPAVRLARFVGTAQLLHRLRELGFRALSKTARHYGLGLALGNGEVTLRQLVNAYATLARNGRYLPLREVLSQAKPASKRLLDSETSYLISTVLADPRARALGFGRHGPLETPFWAAAKTGTSKDFRDNWTIGYTRDLTVGVWVGNFDGSPMHGVSGVTGAAPLWAEVMGESLRLLKLPARPPARPASLVERSVCSLSGALVGPHCPHSTVEFFRSNRQPLEPCAVHRSLPIDRRNGLLARGCAGRHVEQRDVVVLPPRYHRWARAEGLSLAPTRTSGDCQGGSQTKTAQLRIRYPFDGAIFHVDPDLERDYQRLPLEAVVSATDGQVEWLVDGKRVALAAHPFTASWPIESGSHRIEVRLPDGRRSPPVRIIVR